MTPTASTSSPVWQTIAVGRHVRRKPSAATAKAHSTPTGISTRPMIDPSTDPRGSRVPSHAAASAPAASTVVVTAAIMVVVAAARRLPSAASSAAGVVEPHVATSVDNPPIAPMRNTVPSGRSEANACTELGRPLRVRAIPASTAVAAPSTHRRATSRDVACAAAIRATSGASAVFSTGSHAQ